ncbi:hypothetical protein SLE2022_392620 [Rubroshorea leprosula]
MSLFRFFITLFVLSLRSLITEAQNYSTNRIGFHCSNKTTYPSGSNYTTVQSNLHNLFFALSSNGTATAANGFYSTTSGKHPNRVYFDYLCRGDLSHSTCRNCVTFATKDVKEQCPTEIEVVIWYDECLLRYSGKPNFFNESDYVFRSAWNDQNATDLTRFNDTLGTVLNDVTTQAASVAKRFATKEVNISVFDTLYSLVQCTPDLSSTDCSRCLRAAIANHLRRRIGSIGGRFLFPSCNFRYEVYSFYNESAVTALASPPPIVSLLPPASVINPKGSKPKWIPITASSSAVLGLAILSSFAFVIWRRRSSRVVQTFGLRRGNFGNGYSNEDFEGENVGGSHEFPSIQLDIINTATNHFCDENKLGEGGFGSVYKGTLPDGKEIAVKRLSRTSGQGLLEFKNEVMLIARLQHRNLVRLLGCCLEDNETLLVYEYMPNRSLDVFLFDSSMRAQLDWQRRFRIIIGIARGIMYLHEDSRLRIIHRDLKTSNILLDREMNPKISDFGLARIFSGNQIEANTKRVVGTYGYMAPEYAMEGLFSVKSDVFSFGVILLEIISGKKNNGFYFYERGESLLTFAWKLWSQGQGVQLIDPEMVQSCVESEVLKCIHIEPAFFVGRVVAESASPLAGNIVCSINQVTISNVSPR